MEKGMSRAKTIFVESLRQPPGERRAFAVDACGGDGALEERVLALLAAHDEAPPPPDPIEGPGTSIGAYRLLEEIGDGGFGVVYVAEQKEPVQRRVALKVIKPGMDTREVISRFEAERQALALMDHPNIARVFDGGATPGGRPLFVMELVKGIHIHEYCDQCQLPLPARLGLLTSVCRAVQHAHQKGIIHRDLKPSNVLVAIQDGDPVPKVIDFGVAKATGQRLTEATFRTRFAQMIGTPQYMSPEQAEMSALDVDTRADIYSLGVLLYELLTGTTPLTRERLETIDFDELRRIIRDEDPPTPSARLTSLNGQGAEVAAARRTDLRRLVRTVHGDLDWIVMKALEKDRTRRYETVTALASDVERYLADEPVEAGPPSHWYRARKFVRRNRTGVTVATVAVLLLAVGGGVAARVAADRATRRAELGGKIVAALNEARTAYGAGRRAAASAAIQRAEGLASGGDVDAALGARVRRLARDLEMARRLDEAQLAGMVIDPKNNAFDSRKIGPALRSAFAWYGIDLEAFDVERTAGRIRDSVIRDAIVSALDEWEYRGPPTLDRARLYDLIDRTDIHPWRTKLRAAWRSKDTAAVRALVQDPAALEQGSTTLMQAQLWLVRNGEARLATELFRRAQRRHPQDFWINTQLAWLLNLVDPLTEEAIGYLRVAVALRPKSAGTRYNLGRFLFVAAKDLDGAEAEFRAALRLEADYQQARMLLGNVLREQGRLAEAAAEHRRALRLDPQEPWTRYHFGQDLREQDDLPAARAEFEKAIEYARDGETCLDIGNYLIEHGEKNLALTAWAKAVDLDPKCVEAHFSLGVEFAKMDQLEKAIRAYESVAALDYGQLSHRHRKSVVPALVNLANLLKDRGKLDEAIVHGRRAVQLGPNEANARLALGLALSDKGEIGPALAAVRKAIQLAPDNPLTHHNLGVILTEKGELDKAAEACAEAIRLDKDLAVAHCGLAAVMRLKGRPKEAAVAVRKALDADEKCGRAHREKGLLLMSQGRSEEAIAAFRDAAKLFEHEPGGRATCLNDVAYVLMGLGRFQEARPYLEEALRLRESVLIMANLGAALCALGEGDRGLALLRRVTELRPDLAMAHYNVGYTLELRGELKEAALWYRKAIQRDPKFGRALYSLGNVLSRGDDFEGTVDAYRRAAALKPMEAWGRGALAWTFATWPDEKLRDPKRAVEEASKAVKLSPAEAWLWTMLGIAYLRDGQPEEAIHNIRESQKREKSDGYSLFYLAMAQWQSGAKDEARQTYDRAVAWKQNRPPDYRDVSELELRRMQTEAAKLLGIAR
jgi:tetratricopeptide (TPR) repeat protein